MLAAALFATGLAITWLVPGTLWWSLCAPLLYLASLSCVILNRVTSILFGWPVRRAAVRKSVLARHPVLMFVAALGLHLASMLAPETLFLLREVQGYPVLRVSLVILLAFIGLPVWMAVVHPLRYLRGAPAPAADQG